MIEAITQSDSQSTVQTADQDLLVHVDYSKKRVYTSVTTALLKAEERAVKRAGQGVEFATQTGEGAYEMHTPLGYLESVDSAAFLDALESDLISRRGVLMETEAILRFWEFAELLDQRDVYDSLIRAHHGSVRYILPISGMTSEIVRVLEFQGDQMTRTFSVRAYHNEQRALAKEGKWLA